MIRRLGYRLVVRQLTHPEGVSAGQSFSVGIELENVGVAPSYYDHRFAVRIGSATGSTSTASIRHLLPGPHSLTAAATAPASLSPGPHDLSIGVVDPSTEEPVVRLAIAGRDAAGWYPVSTIEVN